jgi:DNA polymerase elongation subunit (family B)
MTALDIETETRFGGGLDPLGSSVVAVALAFDDGATLVFDDSDERALLARVDEVLRNRRGLLLTWNGAGFDLPFIAARARVLGHDALPDFGLVTQSDPALPVKYAPPPGLGGPVRARWHSTAHVDVAHLYRDLAEAQGLQWSLKPIARHHGLEPVEVDRTAIHELSPAELEAYVASDALVTLELARRQPLTALLRAVLPFD